MSWWIIDTVSINEDGDESLCDIQCDTAADLPAADQTGTVGYTIVRGSKALDLTTGDRYIMDSSGSWVKQPSEYQLNLAGYATQSWVSGELAGYVPSTTYNTDQAAQESEIGVIANAGAKNLLRFDGVGTSGDVYTHNGITFKLNQDMTIAVSGTASSNAYAYIKLNGDSVAIDDFCDGHHILSGCPANGSTGTYRLFVGKTGYRKDDTGSGVLLSDRNAISGIAVAPYVSAGYTIPADAPLIFKPMIRRAEITDASFVPFAPTNRELYEMILALQ